MLSIVQSAIGLGSSTGTVSATFPGAVTPGNYIIALVATWASSAGIENCGDNKGNTWPAEGGYLVGTADATTGSATIWYAKAVTGGSSFTVTSTATGVSHMSIVIMEVSYSGTFAVDGTPGTNHSTSNVTSAAVSMGTAAASNSLAVMVINMFEDEAVSSYALTGSTMATVRQNTSTGSASSVIGTGAGNIASTGAKTATANFASSAYVAAAALFKDSGAAPSGTGDDLFAGPG